MTLGNDMNGGKTSHLIIHQTPTNIVEQDADRVQPTLRTGSQPACTRRSYSNWESPWC